MLYAPETAPYIYIADKEDIYYSSQKTYSAGDEEMVGEKEEMKKYLCFTERLISKDNFKSFNRRTGLPFLSNEFKAFENRIKWSAKSQYKGKILVGNLQVLIIAYYKNKVHPDIGNCPKSCLDALQNIIYKNDRQIKKLMIEVVENSDKEYFEIWIKEL